MDRAATAPRLAPASAASAAFGPLLRHWRRERRRSQLELALAAEVSPRHLSFVETGKARASRQLVLRLAEELGVPLRERNALLAAAGYAPAYPERAPGDPMLASARAALQSLLDAHEPHPALAVDRHWNLVAANRLVAPLLQGVDPALLAPAGGGAFNVLKVALHPRGLAPGIVHLRAWRAHVFERLRRQIAGSGDAQLAVLLAELQSLPLPSAAAPAGAGGEAPELPADTIAVPLSLLTAAGRLDFVSTVTVFGAPNDVWLSEIAVETLLAANAATAAVLRGWHEALPPA